MNELIKVKKENGKQVVSARELYLELGLANGQFSRWSKANILDNPFAVENEDWVGFDIDVEGNKVPDYALVISFAKKIAMMSKTEKGNTVRDYFLECEKRSEEFNTPSYQIEDPIKRAERWIEEQKEKQQAQLEAKEAQDNVKRLTHNSKTYTSGEIAKELGFRSAIELNNVLKDKDIQFKQNGTWLLYAKYADLGYTSTKQIVLDNGRITYDRRWTGKGRDFIVSVLGEENGRT